MVVCYPSTPKKLATTIGFFLTGAGLFGYGLHLYYVNAAPQQARVKARHEFVMERLQQRYGYESPYPELKRKYGSDNK